jgi:protein TonB
LEITIGIDGRVTNARALKGDPRLKAASLAAVRQWVYKPTTLNGIPVEAKRQIVLNFRPWGE